MDADRPIIPHMPTTLLLTSIGSLVGKNILDSLEGRRGQLRIIGTNTHSDTPNLFRCDHAIRVPATSDAEAWSAAIRNIIDKQDVDLVFPCRDDEVPLLAAMADEVPDLARRLPVGPSALAIALRDKAASADWAERAGLPFAPTLRSGGACTPRDAFATEHGWPLLAKPARGDGSRGIRLVRNPDELAQLDTLPDFVFQPFLALPSAVRRRLEEAHPGVPLNEVYCDRDQYAGQILIGPDGDIHGSFTFRATMVAGQPTKVEHCDTDAFAELVARSGASLAAAGWRGPVNVQMRPDPKLGWRILEFNGRFTGATHARRLLGFDEVALVVNRWLGAEIVPADPVSVSATTVYKCHSEFVVRHSAQNTWEQTGTWTRSS